MARQRLQDAHYQTIGWIETMSDGRQKLEDAHYCTLGYYDPKTNRTEDARYRLIGYGNLLMTLL